jgi:hypothetical protein
VLAYFRKFDLTAIALTRDGHRLVVTRDPSGHQCAWWLRAADAGVVIKRARACGDVAAAAKALRIKAVEHSVALQRTEQLVDRLDARLASAQANGSLKVFNVAYKQRRQAAFVRGENFLGYSAARSRLRRELVEVAAGGAPAGLVKRVFGDS